MLWFGSNVCDFCHIFIYYCPSSCEVLVPWPKLATVCALDDALWTYRGFPLTLSPYFTILPAGGHSENGMALGRTCSSLVSLCYEEKKKFPLWFLSQIIPTSFFSPLVWGMYVCGLFQGWATLVLECHMRQIKGHQYEGRWLRRSVCSVLWKRSVAFNNAVSC